MSLDDWLDEERRRLERFEIMWRRETKKAPAFYPIEMEPGEWDEQYRAFEE